LQVGQGQSDGVWEDGNVGTKYDDGIEQLHKTLVEKQCALGQNMKDTTVLVQYLERFKEQHDLN
jgi:hypothetical protein